MWEIVAEMQARGEEVGRDAFGHVKLDTINPGQMVRQPVRRHAQGGEDHGVEERILRPVRQRRTTRTWP